MNIDSNTIKAINDLNDPNIEYWDLRIQEIKEENHTSMNKIPNTSISEDYGIGIRILYKNKENNKQGWGFAATNILTEENIAKTCKKALETAIASSTIPDTTIDFEPSTETGEYYIRMEKDPFKMSLKEKQDYVVKIDKMLDSEETVNSNMFMTFKKMNTHFLNSAGSDLKQEIVYTGCAMSVTNSYNGEVMKRGYPNSFGNFRVGGFEIIESYDFESHTERIVKEASEILRSPECPQEKATVVIGPQMMALIVHEVCGHATEYDRILGEESAYAGISFLKTEDIGNFVYGSPIINMVSDPTYPGSAGSFGWDEDGTAANHQYLVKDGIIQGFLTGRGNCKIAGLESAAANRANSYKRMAINRMTSVNFLPGEEFTKNEIISNIENGYYLDDFCGWSINSDRNGFRFSVENMQKIENGVLTTKYKNGAFSAETTPEFWKSCYAVASDKPFVAGYNNCAKGQPVQVIMVGHVVPQATAFNNVKVGK